MQFFSRVTILFSAVVAVGQAEDRPLPAFHEDTCEGGGCSMELLQRGLHVDASDSKPQLQPQGSGHGNVKSGFDCSSYPSLCAEPFNCQTSSGPQYLQTMVTAAIAKNGQPNVHSWCAQPQYHEYLSQCIVEKDLVTAAHTQYNNTKAGKHGENTFQMDGSYCFIDGHCLNRAANENTTLQEATAQCDARYGHKTWTNMGDPQSYDTMSLVAQTSSKYDKSNGFPSQDFTRGYLLLACAMGNYHCDVTYCKETYCKDQDMIQKYGHWLEKLGWTKNVETWFVGASA